MIAEVGWRCVCADGGRVCLRWMYPRRMHRHTGGRTFCDTKHFVRDFETAADVESQKARDAEFERAARAK